MSARYRCFTKNKEESISQLTREALRLKTTAARLKLKESVGDENKRWNMLFNAMLRAKPYHGLTLKRQAFYRSPKIKYITCLVDQHLDGDAWSSSARVLKLWVNSFKRAKLLE